MKSYGLVEAKKDKRSKALNEIGCLYKGFSFTVVMLKGSLTVGQKNH